MGQLTWEAFLALDLVGRDLVNDDTAPGLGFGYQRGPISGIVVGEHGIVIRLRWSAALVNPTAPDAEQRWAFHSSPNSVGVNPMFSAPPVIHDDGRITFAIPYCGTVTILPEGDRLDPRRVEGLQEQPAA